MSSSGSCPLTWFPALHQKKKQVLAVVSLHCWEHPLHLLEVQPLKGQDSCLLLKALVHDPATAAAVVAACHRPSTPLLQCLLEQRLCSAAYNPSRSGPCLHMRNNLHNWGPVFEISQNWPAHCQCSQFFRHAVGAWTLTSRCHFFVSAAVADGAAYPPLLPSSMRAAILLDVAARDNSS